MTFFEQIQDDLKTSMKNRDADRTNTLRLLLAAMKNARVAGTQKEFTDEEDLALVKKQVKQRKESIAQFEAAGRDDLAEGEKKELVILEAYLPPEMDEAAIRAIVLEKKTALGVTDKSGMGKLMGAVMGATNGQADGTVVKKLVEEVLG